MMRKFPAILAVTVLLAATGWAAKKKIATAPTTATVAEMTPEQRVIHALDRLAFGARPGDVDAVGKSGLDAWIESQLHPESIPQNPALEAKLAPLETLRMSTADMLKRYPSQQMLKGMVDGRIPLPEDPQARAAAKFAMARFAKSQKANILGDEAKPSAPKDEKALIAKLPLTDAQKQTLRTGSKDERAALLSSLPADQLMDVIDALPDAMKGRIAGQASPEVRRRLQILRSPQQVVNQDLIEGKLYRAVYSNRQLEEVLTDFWFNHFNIFLDKGADRFQATAYERDVIRPHVLGKFKDLLLATAQSPAMLFYLDNWQSMGVESPANKRGGKKQGLNENYGRELMELHTLGVDGGYTQADVTEVARCFTGWTIVQPQRGGGFEFAARMHDPGEKHVLGVTIPAGGGKDDAMKVLDILLHHPSTAHFISKKLATRFVSDNPSEVLVAKMAKTFTTTDGDIREVLRTMLGSGEFWAADNFRSKVKSPLEMVVSALRAVDADMDSAQQIAGLMNTLGEPLYRKPEPTGYSNTGADWMNSASLVARMNFASGLAQGRLNGINVDPTRFNGAADQIERSILLTEPTEDAKRAIQAGFDAQKQMRPDRVGAAIAGLTLGSPDFQRR